MSSTTASNPDTTGVSAWRRASTFERGIYSSLARWWLRRPDHGAAGSIAIPYVGLVRSTMWLWIWGSALEMVIVHLVVPWPWVRWPLLIVSLWGLLWMLGLLGSQVAHPHLIEGRILRVRSGHTIDVRIPLDSITHLSTTQRSLEKSRVVQILSEHLNIAVSSQVNIHLTLEAPMVAQLPGGAYTFTAISFWADDSSTAAREIRHACENVAD